MVVLRNICQNLSGAVMTPTFSPVCTATSVVSPTWLHVTDKAFSIAGPRAWNALPSHTSLCKKLMTHFSVSSSYLFSF